MKDFSISKGHTYLSIYQYSYQPVVLHEVIKKNHLWHAHCKLVFITADNLIGKGGMKKRGVDTNAGRGIPSRLNSRKGNKYDKQKAK